MRSDARNRLRRGFDVDARLKARQRFEPIDPQSDVAAVLDRKLSREAPADAGVAVIIDDPTEHVPALAAHPASLGPGEPRCTCVGLYAKARYASCRISLSCQRASAIRDSATVAANIATPATAISTSAANSRGMLSWMPASRI